MPSLAPIFCLFKLLPTFPGNLKEACFACSALFHSKFTQSTSPDVDRQPINVRCSGLTTFLGATVASRPEEYFPTNPLRLYNMKRPDTEALREIGDSLEHLEFYLAYFRQWMKDGLFREYFLFVSFQS